jgi:hypothetical protein
LIEILIILDYNIFKIINILIIKILCSKFQLNYINKLIDSQRLLKWSEKLNRLDLKNDQYRKSLMIFNNKKL